MFLVCFSVFLEMSHNGEVLFSPIRQVMLNRTKTGNLTLGRVATFLVRFLTRRILEHLATNICFSLLFLTL